MKNLLALCFVTTMLFLNSCSKPTSAGDSTLDGNTDITLNKTGNTFSTTILANGLTTNGTASASITKNESGVATVHVVANIKNVAALSFVKNLIPTKYIDAQGNVLLDGKVKVTDEGILDYTNADGTPFVMVRYDDIVGDKYKITKADGKVITRTVTQKSTTDDYSHGALMIKTMTVEQDSRIPGISKIIYKFNHRQGIVYIEAVAQDGTKAGIKIFAKSY